VAFGIIRKASVEDGVGNLIAELIGVAFAY
jgi:hypothetical protein